MPQPVPALTDPTGVASIANVSGVTGPLAYPAPVGGLSTAQASLMPSVQLTALGGAVAKGAVIAALANPGDMDEAASALVTFPAIYKAFNTGQVVTPRLPVMREYPPVSAR